MPAFPVTIEAMLVVVLASLLLGVVLGVIISRPFIRH